MNCPICKNIMYQYKYGHLDDSYKATITLFCDNCNLYYYVDFTILTEHCNEYFLNKGYKIGDIISIVYEWKEEDYLEHEFNKLLKLRGFL